MEQRHIMKSNHTVFSKFNRYILLVILCIFLAALLTAASFLFFEKKLLPGSELSQNSAKSKYHFAFICSDSSNHFNSAVYKSAQGTARLNNDYLEFMGKNLAVTYSRNELMEIAIDAKVDGIILQGDESEELSRMIDDAASAKIPVVTFGTDNTVSARKSYVGFGYYELGQTYGKQLLRLEKDTPQKVLVLMTPDADDPSQNIILAGMKDTIEKTDNAKYFSFITEAIPSSTKFEAEEKISNIIMRTPQLPDIIVSLNETYTTCICQALVDYNKVGSSKVIGFYSNDTILTSIQKGIINSSITVNTSQMGKYCVEALNEYLKNGYVNEYMPADIEVITKDNALYYSNASESAEDDN